MSDNYQPETKEDIEADDELFGEVIEQSDAHIESVNVMAANDLSEASSPSTGTTIALPKRKSKHAGIEPEDRPAAGSSADPGMPGLGVALVVVLLLVGGIVFATSSQDPAPQEPAQGSATTTPTEDPAPNKEPIKADSDEGHEDNPTLDADTVTKGLVAAGWRTGEPSVDTMDEVTQSNLLVHRGEAAASITIYESKTWDWANKLLLDTEDPAQAISFGRTVVRVSPGPPDKNNGVVEAFGALNALKKAAAEKAKGAAGDAAEQPEKPAEGAAESQPAE